MVDSLFPSIPKFQWCIQLYNSWCCYIWNMYCCLSRFRPNLCRNLHTAHHGTGIFKKYTFCPFGHAVLLWRVWCWIFELTPPFSNTLHKFLRLVLAIFFWTDMFHLIPGLSFNEFEKVTYAVVHFWFVLQEISKRHPWLFIDKRWNLKRPTKILHWKRYAYLCMNQLHAILCMINGFNRLEWSFLNFSLAKADAIIFYIDLRLCRTFLPAFFRMLYWKASSPIFRSLRCYSTDLSLGSFSLTTCASVLEDFSIVPLSLQLYPVSLSLSATSPSSTL